MSLIRLLLGRRQFLIASLSSALMLAFGRILNAFAQVFQTNDEKAGEKQGSGRKKLRGIIVYYSATGNTAQIANSIYKGMKSVIACDVVPINKMDPKKMGKYDVMAIGSPNWYMREVAVLRRFTHDMPSMQGKHCVLFATHGMQPVGQFWSMSHNVLKKGMTIIGWSDWSGPDMLSPHQMVPHSAWGHPDSIDLAEAEAFGKLMAEYSIRIYSGEINLIPEIPQPDAGESSLWSARVNEKNNITFASPPPRSIPQFDFTKCVYPRCNACIENCPSNAIDLSVLAAASSIIPKDSVVSQDDIFAMPLTKEPSLPSSPIVLKEACQHCGGLCQRVCTYDAIAYAGEKIQITINMKKCTYPKCTLCLDGCPQDCIDFSYNPPVIHSRCEAEGRCWAVCPENAVEVPNMAEIQLKKTWWFAESGMAPMTGGPGRGGGMPPGGPGGGGPGMMMGGESNPRHRSLVLKEDSENATQVMFLTSYPRLPIVKKLWPFHMDEK
jgi:ferredoxin/flavodoxin